MRSDLGADLVHLLVAFTPPSSSDGSYTCGVASTVLQPSAAFGVTLFYSGCRYTFTHELGHNLGLVHDRYQNFTYESGSAHVPQDLAAALANEGSSVAKRHTNSLGRIDERILNRLRDGGKVGHHGLMEPAIAVEIEAQSVVKRQESQRQATLDVLATLPVRQRHTGVFRQVVQPPIDSLLVQMKRHSVPHLSIGLIVLPPFFELSERKPRNALGIQ